MKRLYKFVILSVIVSLVFIVAGFSTYPLDKVTTSYTVSTIYTTVTSYQNSNIIAQNFSAFSFVAPIIIICMWILYYLSYKTTVKVPHGSNSGPDDHREPEFRED